MAKKKNKLTTKQKAFLSAYSNDFNIAKACREAGITRPTYYRWNRDIKEFSEAVESVKETYVDLSEAVINHTLKHGLKTDKSGNVIYVPTGRKTDIPVRNDDGKIVHDENGEILYEDELTYQYSKEAIDAAKFVLTRKGRDRGYVEKIDINADVKAMQTKILSKEEIIDVTPEDMKQMFLEELKNG